MRPVSSHPTNVWEDVPLVQVGIETWCSGIDDHRV